jgi:hypothetical protein
MGIQLNPSLNLTANGAIAIKNIGHAHAATPQQFHADSDVIRGLVR